MNKKKNYLMGAIHKRDSPYKKQFISIITKKAHHQGLLTAPFAVAGVAFSTVTHPSYFTFGLFLPKGLPSSIPFSPLVLPFEHKRCSKGRKQRKTRCLATRVDNEESLEKSFYTSYTKLTEIKLITIGLASPERIRRWAEKILPNGKVIGKVTNSNTVHHKTFKPQKGGLFCERIFGPLKDFECACGKTQKPFSFSDSLPSKTPLSFAIDPFSLPLPLLPLPSFTSSSPSENPKGSSNRGTVTPLPLIKAMEEGTGKGGMEVGGIKDRENELKRNYCPTCDVEYTWSVSRRYQLGYIELVEPMTHVWYLKATPSYLSILLDIKKKHLENVVYGAETMTLENSFHSFSFIKFFAQPDLSTLPSSPSLLLPSVGSSLLLPVEEPEGKDKNKGSQIRTIKPTNYKSKGLFWFSKTESKKLEWSSKWALNPLFVLRRTTDSKKKNEKKRSSSFYLKNETTGPSFYKRTINRKQPKETNFLSLRDRRGFLLNTEGVQKDPLSKVRRGSSHFSYMKSEKEGKDWRNNRGRTLALSLLFFKGNKNKTEPKGFFFLLSSYFSYMKSENRKSFHSLFAKGSIPFSLPKVLLPSPSSHFSYMKSEKNYVGPEKEGKGWRLKEKIGRKKQGELSFRPKNSYDLLLRNKSRVSLSKYKLTQKNMVEKAYRRIYSWPVLLARPLLLLLSNNKQRINNNLKDDTLKTGIREITQKFPIELYILSSIERIVCRKKKKSIRLTTQKAWKKLYQKAYKKASLKASQILRKFVSRKANSNKVNKSISQIQRFASFPFVGTTPLVKEGNSFHSFWERTIRGEQFFFPVLLPSDRKEGKDEGAGKGSKGKSNLGFKLSQNAFSKNIKVNSIKQAKLIFLSRILFENQFRSSLSIAPLNKEMNLLSSRPLSFLFEQKEKSVLLSPFFLNALAFKKKDYASTRRGRKDKPLRNQKLTEQGFFLNKKKGSNKLSFIKEKNLFLASASHAHENKDKKQHVNKNLKANVNTFIPLNSVILSDTNIRVATQITIEKQAIEMIKEIKSIIHCLTKGLVRIVLLKKAFLPLPFSYPSCSLPTQAGGKGSSKEKKQEGGPAGFFFPVLRRKEGVPYHNNKGKVATSFRSERRKKKQKEIKGSKQGPDLIQSWGKVRPRRRVNSHKLVNNVYSLSHRHRWDADEAGKQDWTSFLEYVSAPIFLTDKAIPKYEYRLNPSALATLVSYHNESLNYKAFKKIENFNVIASFFILKERVLLTKKGFFLNTVPYGFFDEGVSTQKEGSSNFLYPAVAKQESREGAKKKGVKQAFSSAFEAKRGELLRTKKNQDTRVNTRGSGLIKTLLTEFNLKTTLDSLPQRWDSGDSRKTELNKLDKQNRILLYESNKKIYRLKQILIKETFWDYELSDKKNNIMKKNLKKDIKELLTQRNLLIRRTKLVRKLFISTKSGQCPSSMVLSLLPVLPPDLRPIVKMGSGASAKVAATDLNKLYQRVIYRNDNLKLSTADPGNSDHSQFSRALLQMAVDNLIQNNKSGVPAEKDSRGRPLKSLSDILKGKQGRFRQYLLGKRVDYSGRSVIIVGPKLKIHQCGIPKEMALELFLPFLLKKILNYNLARTVVGAKALITTNKPLIWELLTEIMRVSPVLLNRAPTLHRLGIQAFIPKLVDGRAILLHPLVCSAFNADFDGDQMAVHVPITVESRAEAWKLMLARNNLLSPATGEPISIPSQDMVLGCYYLTTQCPKGATKKKKGFGFYFKNEEDVLKAYDQQKIDLHALIWLQFNGIIEDTSETELPIEIRITKYGIWKEINPKSHITFNSRSGIHSLPFKGLSLPPLPTENKGKTPLSLWERKDKNLSGSKARPNSFLKRVGHLDFGLDEPQRLGFFKINHYIKTTPGKIVFNRIIQKSIKY